MINLTATSMYNVAALQRREIPLESIENAIAGIGSYSLLRVAEVLESHGLYCRNFKTTYRDLSSQSFPGLVSLAGRLVVAVSQRGNFIEILDPEHGTIKLEKSKFISSWDSFYLTVGKTPLEEASSSGWALLKIVTEWWHLLVFVVVLALLLSGLGVLRPMIIQRLIDEYIYNHSTQNFSIYIAGLAGLIILRLLISLVSQEIFNEFAIRYELNISTLLFRHILRLKHMDFLKFRTTDLVSRLDLIWQLRETVSITFVYAFVAMVSLIFFVGAISLVCWQAGLIALAILPILVAISMIFRPLLLKEMSDMFLNTRKMNLSVVEGVASMAMLRAMNFERTYFIEKFEKTFLNQMGRTRKLSLLQNLIGGSSQLFVRILGLGAVLATALKGLDGQLSPGQVFVVSALVNMMVSPIYTIVKFIMILRTSQITALNLSSVFKTGETSACPVKQDKNLNGAICFENVSFRYGEELPWVLSEVNFTIANGEWISVVGSSGCGKSTLTMLLNGQLKPTRGRIVFNGTDLSTLTDDCIHRQIGYVLQKNDLFEGTIAENICYCDDRPNLPKIRHAAFQAGVSDFVDRLHGGLEHRVRATGSTLSGGEAQRIGIARTLYRSPEIAIFDEPTSNLDERTESRILENLLRERSSKTTIFATHRLNVIHRTNRILVFHEGRLIEEGCHEDLIKRQSVYCNLFKIYGTAI